VAPLNRPQRRLFRIRICYLAPLYSVRNTSVPWQLTRTIFVKEQAMPIILWLLGVPIVVIVLLYLLHVI
jgi:hypothetical protein